MNCNSRHSFNLYYQRFSSHFQKWIFFLTEVLQWQKLEPYVTLDVKRKWNQFIELINSLKIDQMIESSPRTDMIFRFEYVGCLFNGNKMGLGP